MDIYDIPLLDKSQFILKNMKKQEINELISRNLKHDSFFIF